MKTQTKDSVNEWCINYERARPDHLRFTSKIEHLFTELLQFQNISFHLIESRTKEVSSFRDKVTRASKAYSNPMSEITDLSGLRIITYYQSDAVLIRDLIEAEFEVDSANTVEHSPSGSEFGYRSAHYVVRISSKRSALMEWAGLSDFRLEIQVRTVLQHAWAAISHKLQYKRENDVPEQLRRKLFRLSALFELADDEFISLRDASDKLSSEINNKLAVGDQSVKIDHVSLSQFLEKSELVETLVRYAEVAGFNFEHPDFEVEDYDSISDLIQLVGIANINDVSEFDALLHRALPRAEDYLKTQYSRANDSDTWYATPAFICSLVVIGALSKTLKVLDLKRVGWDREIAQRVINVANELEL